MSSGPIPFNMCCVCSNCDSILDIDFNISYGTYLCLILSRLIYISGTFFGRKIKCLKLTNFFSICEVYNSEGSKEIWGDTLDELGKRFLLISRDLFCNIYKPSRLDLECNLYYSVLNLKYHKSARVIKICFKYFLK